jgi:hypothetical protein
MFNDTAPLLHPCRIAHCSPVHGLQRIFVKAAHHPTPTGFRALAFSAQLPQAFVVESFFCPVNETLDRVKVTPAGQRQLFVSAS